MNLNYVRAAILENTKVDLSMKEVIDLLLEEQMITLKQARKYQSIDYTIYDQEKFDYRTDIMDLIEQGLQ